MEDKWFRGSLRMPKAVEYDRESMRDWVECESLNILENHETDDPCIAQKWAWARLEGSPALLRALVPELSRANPKPIRCRLWLALVLELAAWIAFRFWTLQNFTMISAGVFAVALVCSRLLLLRGAETVLLLRGHCSDAWLGMIAMLGSLGYGAYHLFCFCPRRKQELAELKKVRKNLEKI